MSNPVHVVALLVLIFIWLLPAVFAGKIAERKGRSLVVYVVAGLIVGPLVLLIALILPRRESVA